MSSFKPLFVLQIFILLVGGHAWSFADERSGNIFRTTKSIVSPVSENKPTASRPSETTNFSGGLSVGGSSTKPPLKAYRPWENGYKPIGMGKELKTQPDCAAAYVDEDGGEYGERAIMLMKEIVNSPLSSKFLDEPIPDISKKCPGFDESKVGSDSVARHNLRLNFWVNLFGRLASYESSCQINENRVCSDGMCGGHFRMPEAPFLRVWRLPRQFRSAGEDWDLQDMYGCRADYRVPGKVPKELWADNPGNDTACAVETMGGMLCGNYNTNKEQCTTPSSAIQAGGYWEELRLGGKIPEDLKKLPICKTRSAKNFAVAAKFLKLVKKVLAARGTQ